MHDLRHGGRGATVCHTANIRRRITVLAVASIAGPTMPMWAVYTLVICVGLALAMLAGGGHRG